MNQASSRGQAPKSPGEEPPRQPEWDGQPLATEGEVALVVLGGTSPPPGVFPAPVIAAARGGEVIRLIPPGRITEFLRIHASVALVCERAGLLHGMLEEHFETSGDRDGLERLWAFSRAGRLLDVILFDQLLDMAEKGVDKNPCPLHEIAKSRCDLAIPDARLGTRVEGSNEPSRGPIDPAIERVAVERVEALMAVFQSLRTTARQFARRDVEEYDGDDQPGLSGTDGFIPPTLGIQVMGEIALEQLNWRGGLWVEAAGDLIECCERTYRESSTWLAKTGDSKNCFKWCGPEVCRDRTRKFPVEYDEKLRRVWQ